MPQRMPAAGPRARPAATIAVSAVLALLLLAGPAAAGSIKGTVVHAGAVPPPKKLAVTIDQYVCGKEKDAEDLVVSAGKGIRNAVVWLETPPPGGRPDGAPRPVQMDQQGCVFVPRVLVVPTGGTVEFLNSDRLLHNLHSAGKENPTFNRTQPKGRTIPVTFKKPEIVRIDCDLHSWMRGWVVVAEHPFYAVTGPEGDFVLDNVPPGRYTLRVWQEALGIATQEVTVGQGAAAVTVPMGRR